jgi:RNase P/RNase MRP subunit p29
MDRDVKFRIINRKNGEEAGLGKTIDMSSNGVLIETENTVLPGRRVEIAISWPAQLNGACPLKLVARGRIVRVDGARAAVEIQQYEFRTQGKSAIAAQ